MTAVACIVLSLAGCGKVKYPALPVNAIEFDTGEYVDTSDNNAGYMTLEYEGRIYIPYGTVKIHCAKVMLKHVPDILCRTGKRTLT